MNRLIASLGWAAFACVIACTAALLPQTASAQDAGFYVAGDLGYHWPDTLNAKVGGNDQRWTWNPNGGAEGFVRLGYGFASDWRVELEAGDRTSPVGGIRAGIFLPFAVSAPGVRLSDVGGHVDATTLMANALYDIPLGLPLQPFVGAGAGLVSSDVASHGRYSICSLCESPAICYPTCEVNIRANGSSDALGVQGIAGVSWPFAPGWTLDATYRYLRSSDIMWNGVSGTGLFTPGDFRSTYSDNSVTLGIRYSL